MTDKKPAIARVTQHFMAAPERVFDAWLDPKMIGRFMYGPHLRDEEVIHIKTDPRVGGMFSFLVRRQGQVIDHVGEYRAIDRPRRLVFTWGLVGVSDHTLSVVTIDIKPAGKGCDLTLEHALHPDWSDYRERTQQGWTFMVGKLAEELR